MAKVRHANPSMIEIIQCEVTLNDIVSGHFAAAHIGGRFYNSDGSGGSTGDIRAILNIGDLNGDLAARWHVGELQNDGSWNLLGDGVLLAPITLGTTYTLRITYDGNTGFEFEISGVTTQFSGPVRQGAAYDPTKNLGTLIVSDIGSAVEFISAEFDNFYIDDGGGLTLYDNFSTAPLDQTKWIYKEVALEVSNEELRLNVQGIDAWAHVLNVPARKTTAPYLETTALVESGSQISPGAVGYARIGGNYYNENRGPGSSQNYNEYEDTI